MGKFSDALIGPQQPAPPTRAAAEAQSRDTRFSDQLLGAVPAADPGIEALSGSREAADLGDIARASFIDDPNTRARFYARERGLPIERYRILDGDVIYQGDDQQWYYEQPKSGLSDILVDPGKVLKSAAAGVGPAVPMGAGAIAGTLSAPMLLAGPLGMAGSMGITGAATGAGEAAKDAIGSYVSGESQMDVQSPLQEAAAGALGQGIGGGMTMWANRGAVRDIGRLDRPAAQALQRKAQAQDIPLTAAELTNLRTLKGQQTALGNIPRSGEILDDFYFNRAGKMDDAVGRFLQRVSPEDSAEAAGIRIADTAEAARDALKGARKAATTPLYQAARNSGAAVDVSDALKYIDDRLPDAKGPIAQALQRVRGLLFEDADQTILDSRVGALHEAKVAIAKMIKQAPKDPSSADNFIMGDLRQIQGRLTDALKRVPEYKLANDEFARLSVPLDEFSASTVEPLLRLKDRQAFQAAAKLFSPTQTGPKAAFNARAILQRQDPEAWQAIKRAYLENVWREAPGRAAVDAVPDRAGAVFAHRVLGDKKQAGILKAVLDDPEWQALNDLGEVLEATGRTVRRGSHTTFMAEAVDDLRADARGVVGGTARAAFNPMTSFREWVDRVMLGRHSEKLAGLITDPDSLNQLKQIRMLPPNSARARAIVGQALTRAGIEGADELLSPSGGAPQAIRPREPQAPQPALAAP